MNRIVFVCLGLIFILSIACIWAHPAYERGIEMGIQAIAGALSTVLGAKYALAVPDQQRAKPLPKDPPGA